MDEIVFERASYFGHDGYKIMETRSSKKQWLVFREEWKFPGGVMRDLVTVQAMRQFDGRWNFAKNISKKHYDHVRWPAVLSAAIAQAVMNCVDKDNLPSVASEDSISDDLESIGG